MMETLTDDNYNKIVDDRMSIVKVHAKWCGPCKLLKPRFKKWSKKFNIYNGEEIKYYEIDGDKCKNFKKEFNIDRYPTTLFFVYGVLIFTQYGVTRESVHENLIKNTLQVRYEKT